MGSVPPTRRERSIELARRCLFASALSALAACAGLLDLPDDPRLAEPAEPAAPGAPDGEAPPRPPVQTEDEPEPTDEGTAPRPDGEGMSGVELDPPESMTSTGGVGDPPAPETPNAGAGVDDDDEVDDEVDAPPDAAPADPCLDGATLGPNGRCYATVTAALTWADARDACQSLGAGWDLTTIRDAAANEFVAELMPVEAWLGGSDAAIEGAWVWVTDNQPFWNGTGDDGAVVDGAFENWNSDEPNGAGPSDCIRLVTGLGTWADLQCTFERPAVCEGPQL